MSTRFCAVVLFVLWQLAAIHTASAQYFLTMPSSPQAIGRGGLYLSSESDDPLAPLTNPALLGLSAERNRVMAGFYPSHAEWSPMRDSYAVGYASRVLSFGLDRQTLGRFLEEKTPFSVGLGYIESKLDFGKTQIYDENGHVLGTRHTYEATRGWCLALGYHGKHVQAGAGWTGKYVSMLPYNSQNWMNIPANDLGLYVQSRWDKVLDRQNDDMSWRVSVIPSASYTLSNFGGDYHIPNEARSEALPRTAAVNLSLATGLRSNSIAKGEINVIGVEVGEQVGSFLARVRFDGSHYYTNPLGTIEPLNDLVLGKAHELVSHQQGIEVSVLETAYARWGDMKQENDGYFNYGGHSYTTGFGARLAGVLKMVTANSSPSGVAGVLMHHLDLQYQYATLHDRGGTFSSLDGMTYQEIALLWRN